MNFIEYSFRARPGEGISMYLTHQELHLVKSTVAKPGGVEKQSFKWLFLAVNGERRPVKIKTQPGAVLWRREDLYFTEEPPKRFISGEGMRRRRVSHAYLSAITLTVMTSSHGALLMLCTFEGGLSDEN